VGRSQKLVVWIVVLAACAGVGAFIASRSNPFPPGVEDPGVRPTAPTGSTPLERRWTGSEVVRTSHRLFVGGSCRTSWRLRVSVLEEGDRLTGRGSATLAGAARCDFPTVQTQTRHLLLQVEGRIRGSKLRLTFAERVREPAGSMDLGGLLPLLDRLRLRLEEFDPDLHPGVALGGFNLTVPDGDRGSFTVRCGYQLVRQP